MEGDFSIMFVLFPDLLIMTDVPSRFDPIPGLERWHHHILTVPVTSYVSEIECAVACLARSTDCSYYVYGAGGFAEACHLGSFSTVSKAKSALESGSEAVTVNVVNGEEA